MTKRILLFAMVPACIAALLALDPPAPRSAAARSALAPAVKTGAPSEGTCQDCHDGNLDDGVGSVSISVASLAAEGYTPGQVYDVTVTQSRSGSACWGFSLTALRNTGNTMAGALTAGTDNLTATRTATVNASSRTYVSQTTSSGADGTFSGAAGPANWTFKWTAPAAGAGAVTLYVCGLAADNDGGTSTGDHSYTGQKVIQELIPTATRATTWGAIKNTYR